MNLCSTNAFISFVTFSFKKILEKVINDIKERKRDDQIDDILYESVYKISVLFKTFTVVSKDISKIYLRQENTAKHFWR